jgi:hypothetical protein
MQGLWVRRLLLVVRILWFHDKSLYCGVSDWIRYLHSQRHIVRWHLWCVANTIRLIAHADLASRRKK